MKLEEVLEVMFNSEVLFIKEEYCYKALYTGSAEYFRSSPELMEKYRSRNIYRICSVKGGIAVILKSE